MLLVNTEYEARFSTSTIIENACNVTSKDHAAFVNLYQGSTAYLVHASRKRKGHWVKNMSCNTAVHLGLRVETCRKERE